VFYSSPTRVYLSVTRSVSARSRGVPMLVPDHHGHQASCRRPGEKDGFFVAPRCGLVWPWNARPDKSRTRRVGLKAMPPAVPLGAVSGTVHLSFPARQEAARPPPTQRARRHAVLRGSDMTPGPVSRPTSRMAHAYCWVPPIAAAVRRAGGRPAPVQILPALRRQQAGPPRSPPRDWRIGGGRALRESGPSVVYVFA